MREVVDVVGVLDAWIPAVEEALKNGEVGWLWMSPPRGSFSPLRNLDHGGPLRPGGSPAGDAAVRRLR